MTHYKLFFFLTISTLTLFSSLYAEQWSEPEILSLTGQNATSPQIAIDPQGNAIAIWNRFDEKHMVIQASIKPIGKEWQKKPHNLSLPGQHAFNAQLVIDKIGNVTVAWQRFNGHHHVIEASTKPIGGRWQSKPDQLSTPNQDASVPQLAVDSYGNVIVVWQISDGNSSIIQSSVKSTKGTWQKRPSNLSLSQYDSKNPQIVIDSHGLATVVWQASNGTAEVIQSATKPFQNKWQSPQSISKEKVNNSNPQICIDPFDNLTVVWNEFNGTYGSIQSVSKLANKNWQKNSQMLSIPGKNTFSPQVASNTLGDVTAVWEAFDEKKIKSIHTSTKRLGEAWQNTPDCISFIPDHCVTPQIAIDLNNNVTVVWNNFKGFRRIFALTKYFGQNWDEVKTEIISSDDRAAFSPQVAYDPFGKVIVVWVMQDSLSFIQTSSFP